MKLHVEGFGCQMYGYVWFASGPVRNLKREASEDMKALRQIIAEHKKLQAENARLREELHTTQLERDAIKREWDKAYEIAMLATHNLAAARQARDALSSCGVSETDGSDYYNRHQVGEAIAKLDEVLK